MIDVFVRFALILLSDFVKYAFLAKERKEKKRYVTFLDIFGTETFVS
jgi:hypothetical protein